MESHLGENGQDESDSERNEIRSELSKMSFEDLQKLKAKLGAKVYKEAMHGVTTLKRTKFKSLDKNRPREVSSKIKPTFKQNKKPKNNRIVDPRFNRLCGTFNQRYFDNNYEFLSEIRKREKEQLQNLLMKEKDPNEINKIKYLLQRMENQDREKKMRARKRENREKEKKEQIEALESGKKPYFRTKYERKIVDLVDKYHDLKKSGKIEKYIEKKQKKQNIKEKQKRYYEIRIPDK